MRVVPAGATARGRSGYFTAAPGAGRNSGRERRFDALAGDAEGSSRAAVRPGPGARLAGRLPAAGHRSASRSGRRGSGPSPASPPSPSGRTSGWPSGAASGSRSLRWLLSAAVGVPLAFLFERAEFPGRRVLGALVALPVALPPLVGVIAFLFLYGESGFVSRGGRRRLAGLDEPPVATGRTLGHPPRAHVLDVRVLLPLHPRRPGPPRPGPRRGGGEPGGRARSDAPPRSRCRCCGRRSPGRRC